MRCTALAIAMLLLLGACAREPADNAATTAGARTAALAPRAGGLAPAGTAADQYWQRFATAARRDSSGGIDPILLTRGELGSDEQILQSLRRGRIQLSINGAHAISGVVPEMAALGLPYLFDSGEQAEYIAREHLVGRIDPLLQKHGLKLLRLIPMGFHNFYARREIRRPQDLRGLRVRQPGDPASSAYAAALGLDLAPLPASEIVTALQTGLIQAGTTVTLNYLWGGMSRDAPNLTLTRHAYLFNAVLANDAWWRSLSEADRRTIDAAFPPASEFIALMNAAETTDLAKAVGRGEVNVTKLSSGELSAWQAPAAEVRRRLLTDWGSSAQQLYDAIEQGKADWTERATTEKQ